MSLADFIISVYCLIDDQVKRLSGCRLRQRGYAPQLTDSEMITMEIVAEFLSIDTDKGAWAYFDQHWHDWFPTLGSRANFAKQAANLWQLKQRLQKQLAESLGAFSDRLHLADGFPLPVCHFKRAHFSRIFASEADYGYCAAKGERYYGFKGNVLISSQGVMTEMTVAPAHYDERASLWELVETIQGRVIADKGLIGADYQAQLRQHTQIDLQTAARANMKETRSNAFIRWLKSTRRLVETVIGQLAERFTIEKIRARKLWYLTNRMARKMLSHTMAMLINKQLGNPLLQFDLILKP